MVAFGTRLPKREAEAFDKLVRRRSKAATGAEDGMSTALVLRAVMRAAIEAEGIIIEGATGPDEDAEEEPDPAPDAGAAQERRTDAIPQEEPEGAGAAASEGEPRQIRCNRSGCSAWVVCDQGDIAYCSDAHSDAHRAEAEREDEAEGPPERQRYVERDDARKVAHTWVVDRKTGSKRCSSCETWEHSDLAQAGCPGPAPRLPTSAMERAVDPEARRIDRVRTLRGSAP